MRTLLTVPVGLALGFLLLAACGNSNTAENSCTDTGNICLKSGAACGDTQPYDCPSGGICCSPTFTNPSSEKISENISEKTESTQAASAPSEPASR
jgi:hypothetical protein